VLSTAQDLSWALLTLRHQGTDVVGDVQERTHRPGRVEAEQDAVLGREELLGSGESVLFDVGAPRRELGSLQLDRDFEGNARASRQECCCATPDRRELTLPA